MSDFYFRLIARAVGETNISNMRLVCAVILSGILHNCIRAVLPCSPPEGWFPQSPLERVRKADMVIYGTVRHSPRHNAKKALEGLYTALFEVHCILKGNVLPNFINVSDFGYAGGLCTNSPAYVNKTYIAFIRRDVNSWDNSSRFCADEINVQSATILIKGKPSKLLLKDVVKMVGTNAVLPYGAGKDSLPGCPRFTSQPSMDDNPTSAKRRGCQRKSHRHKKRKHKKCALITPPTQGTENENKRVLANTSTNPSWFNTTTTTEHRRSYVEFLFLNRTTARGCSNKAQIICWRFLLIFCSFVFAVLKWRHT